jgi:hypothetical protein
LTTIVRAKEPENESQRSVSVGSDHRGIFLAASGLSMQPFPQDSGLSGFINLAEAITAESDMIAGNDPAYIGKKRIDSLTGIPFPRAI